MSNKKCGYVAIVGRPNVGKSTLLNTLIGQKVSITSPKPQTTRSQIVGINTLSENDEPTAQVVYIDTPGMHREGKRAMNRYMNKIANAVLLDADVIVFMVDATGWRDNDELVLEAIRRVDKPVILAINKIDLVSDKASLLPLLESLAARHTFAHLIPLTAKVQESASKLEQEIVPFLPEHEFFYPEDQLSDRPIRFLAAEIIREKIIQDTEEELPYATTVEIETFTETEKLVEIGAIIWVERSGQKIIVIGKKGARLKKIGIKARKDLEKLVEKKVFLRLWIKVKEDWTDNETALRSFGYDE